MKRVFRHPAFWLLVINFPGIFIPPFNFFNFIAVVLVIGSAGWLVWDAVEDSRSRREHW